jgi:hypothetical protein
MTTDNEPRPLSNPLAELAKAGAQAAPTGRTDAFGNVLWASPLSGVEVVYWHGNPYPADLAERLLRETAARHAVELLLSLEAVLAARGDNQEVKKNAQHWIDAARGRHAS